MGRVLDAITAELATFLEAQPVFFVATAPLATDGHVNCSPKGLDTFAVIGPSEVAYLDLTGSGAETIAHLGENGRITLMFCAFDGAPKIVRLYGRGESIPISDPRAGRLLRHFQPFPGRRSVVRVAVERVSTSCGYGVPVLHAAGDRRQLLNWAERKGEGLRDYRVEKNTRSIDGLPALDAER